MGKKDTPITLRTKLDYVLTSLVFRKCWEGTSTHHSYFHHTRRLIQEFPFSIRRKGNWKGNRPDNTLYTFIRRRTQVHSFRLWSRNISSVSLPRAQGLWKSVGIKPNECIRKILDFKVKIKQIRCHKTLEIISSVLKLNSITKEHQEYHRSVPDPTGHRGLEVHRIAQNIYCICTYSTLRDGKNVVPWRPSQAHSFVVLFLFQSVLN